MAKEETHIQLMKRLIQENERTLAEAEPMLFHLEERRAESEKRHNSPALSRTGEQSPTDSRP